MVFGLFEDKNKKDKPASVPNPNIKKEAKPNTDAPPPAQNGQPQNDEDSETPTGPNGEKHQDPSINLEEDDKSVAEILDFLVKDALEKTASDIHIEPREKDMIVRYRVDGILRKILTMNYPLTDVVSYSTSSACPASC